MAPPPGVLTPSVPTASILAVRGLEKTSQLFRALLWHVCARHGWNVDDIAAVIAIESGFDAKAKNPLGSATGLLQWIESTAKSVFGFGVDRIRTLSAEEQVPLIERYYERVFAGRFSAEHPPRRVDYYAAVFGPGLGQAFDTVLAREDAPKTLSGGKHNVYTQNALLDADKSGTITVADLDAKLAAVQRGAKGERLSAEMLPWPPVTGGTVLVGLMVSAAVFQLLRRWYT